MTHTTTLYRYMGEKHKGRRKQKSKKKKKEKRRENRLKRCLSLHFVPIQYVYVLNYMYIKKTKLPNKHVSRLKDKHPARLHHIPLDYIDGDEEGKKKRRKKKLNLFSTTSFFFFVKILFSLLLLLPTTFFPGRLKLGKKMIDLKLSPLYTCL